MEHLWSPWRYSYIVGENRPAGCVFCTLPAEDDDRKNLIISRSKRNFIILNLFPYSNGHTMIVPNDHKASLTDLDENTTGEMMELTKNVQRALENEYNPDGFNVGFNLGKCAGAGIAEHLHLHIVPRWLGDANFVSVIGETRTIPESLSDTYDRLKKHF